MGLFQKKSEVSHIKNKESILNYDIRINKNDWFDIYSASLGRVMANQNNCGDIVVKNQKWNVDLRNGVLAFGKDEYPIQFIGSESKLENTWLWGWENINHFPDALLNEVKLTKSLGIKYQLAPLTTAEFELDETFNGHNLTIVTCAISERNYCYYRCPHQGGAIFVTFSGIPEEVFAPIDALKFMSIAMDCINNFDIEHRIFIESFLLQNNTPYEMIENTILAHFDRNVTISFDEFWRICNLQII